MDPVELANLKMELAFLEDMQERYSSKTEENPVYIQLMVRIQDLISTLEDLPQNVEFFEQTHRKNLQ